MSYKILIFTLAIAILTPSFVKLRHALLNHKHEVCLETHKTHFHTLDVECEFYKFKVNIPFTMPLVFIEKKGFKEHKEYILSPYNFTNHFKFLDFSLRAPPQLVS